MINSAGKPINAMTSCQKDTTHTKIFVGGLPYNTSDDALRKYFEVYGEIEEAVVICDRVTQKSRGYGFVTMKEKDAASRACKDANPIIDGRKANVNLAYIGAKPRGVQHSAGIYNMRAVQPYLPTAQLGGFNLFPYGQQPQVACVTPNGLYIQAPQPAPQPQLIDYGVSPYVASGYAADAQTAAAVSASQYTATAHAAALGGAVQTPLPQPHNLFAAPQYHPSVYTALQVPPLATTPTQNANYAAQLAQIQQGP